MTIKEYAEDMNLTVEQVLALCDREGIDYEDETTTLDDTQITLLDNAAGDLSNEEDNSSDEYDDYEDDEDVEDKAEALAQNTKFDLENSTSFEKVKPKNNKKTEVNNANKVNNKNFLKERKKMYKHREKLQSNEAVQDENVILYKEGMTVTEIATALEVAPVEIVKKLMMLGVMANINQTVDFDTASVLVTDYNKVLKKEESADISNFENLEIEDREEDLIERPPVVTIMGHVDHGKTTLLDYIRKSSVVAGEAGGITQAIGAYSVKCNGKNITFIDTPGHAAFTEMRARGASITDIVIIIVAADDGVMPQTKEAIDHAKAAGVPIIVAINKIDKPEANIERIMTGLVENGLTPEEWGGDVVTAKISAKTGQGVPELLESVLLISEMQELKANPNRYASGAVIEAKKDEKTGSTATLLIQNGTLRIGDPIVVGNFYGKVRTLKNDLGVNIVEASPSTPVEVTGLSEVPSAGDKFMAFESEKQAKQIATERQLRSKEEASNLSGMSLEDLFGRIQEGVKEIKVVLKADVNGSLEAVKNALEKIDVEGVKVSVIRGAVGAITESDIVLASASDAIIIGFNVRADNKTQDTAKQYGITIKNYDIIYKAVEEMEAAMKGMLEPEYEEKVQGTLEIRQIFKFSKVGLIAGCHVLTGTVKNGEKARIIRDGIVVYNGSIKTLQHEKDQVKEVKKDMDCGLTLENCQDYKEKDIIEVYDLVEIKR
ncbi:MAG: translation initiation factor IF-2 [Bacilli bacterium]|nr:translation initiation factor IF-2 [Bacilli bacterium]